jgi:tetratricopeptide (TPR) repeat protein
VIVPLSAMRIVAEEPVETKVPKAVASGTTLTVTPQLESIEDSLLTRLGKIHKAADRFVSTPEDGEEWYERAYDLYHAERYEEAAAAFRRAADEGYAPERALYNAACSYALLSDAERAISTLTDALAAGWDDIDKIADDSDFDAVRSDPRFARAIDDQSGEVARRRVTRTVARYDRLRSRDLDAKDGDAWFDVGLDLLRLRRLDQAIEAFEHSLAAGEKTSASMYNLACAYSLRGDVAKLARSRH